MVPFFSILFIILLSIFNKGPRPDLVVMATTLMNNNDNHNNYQHDVNSNNNRNIKSNKSDLAFHKLTKPSPIPSSVLNLIPLSSNSADSNSYSYFNKYPLTDNNYNRNIRPHEGSVTDHVQIGLFVNSVRSVSEIDMTMIVDAFLQAQWQDHRLIPTWSRLSHEIYGDKCRVSQSGATPQCPNLTITLGKAFSEAIWRPDFYLPSAINIYPADDYNDNVCVRLDPDGSLFYSNRVIITISCPMKLVYFPFDSHTCTICIGSYKYHDGLVKMTWSSKLSGMYERQSTANFIIRNESTWSVLHAVNKSMPFIGDIFTEHCFEIVIDRKYNIFLVTLYLPSVALVALSWVNFWIDPKAIPARAGLSITAILAQITLIVGMASRFPSVSDLKMADLYLTVNFIYTFATLIEFAVVSYKPSDPEDNNNTSSQSQLPISRNRNVDGGLRTRDNSSSSHFINSSVDADHNCMMTSESINLAANQHYFSNGSILLDENPEIAKRRLQNKNHQHNHQTSSSFLLAKTGKVPVPNLSNPVCGLPSNLSVIRNLGSSCGPTLHETDTFLAPNKSCTSRMSFMASHSAFDHPTYSKRRRKHKRKKPKPRTNVDVVSKFFFPATFGFWNVLFFSANLYLADRLNLISETFWHSFTS